MNHAELYERLRKFRTSKEPLHFTVWSKESLIQEIATVTQWGGAENVYGFRQGASSLCGPAAILHFYSQYKPYEFAKYVLDLVETGKGKLGTISVVPSRALKSHKLDWQTASMRYVDWVALASLRDSENEVFNYSSPSDMVAGITLPDTMIRWAKAMGFSVAYDSTSLIRPQGIKGLEIASRYYSAGYPIILFLNANIIDGAAGVIRKVPNHWFPMTSNARVTKDHSTGEYRSVELTGLYNFKLPKISAHNKLELDKVDNGFFGFIALGKG